MKKKIFSVAIEMIFENFPEYKQEVQFFMDLLTETALVEAK